MIKKVKIKCEICRKLIFYDFGKMTKHMKDHHENVDLREYFKRHVRVKLKARKKNGSNGNPGAEFSSASSGSDEEFVPSEGDFSEESLSGSESSTTENESTQSEANKQLPKSIYRKAKRVAKSYYFEYSSSNSDSDVAPFQTHSPAKGTGQKRNCPESIKWSNQCLFTCSICDFKSKIEESVRYHISNSHAKAGKVKRIETKRHQCGICDIYYIWSYKCVFKHCKFHGLTVQEYYESFAKGLR